jgi:hypothetical protein
MPRAASIPAEWLVEAPGAMAAHVAAVSQNF